MTADAELDVDALAEALGGDEDGRRLLALDALQECDRRGPLPEAILGPLIDCLRSRRKAVQRTAAEVLSFWSRITPEVRPRLLALLAEGELTVRWGAAFALAKIGPEPATLEVLLETLGQADGDMRWAAQGIVLALARREPAILERLTALAGAGSSAQRKMALYCLRDLGRPLPGLLEKLTNGLRSEDGDVRLAALSALAGLFGDHEESVPPILELAASDPEPGVRRAAVSTLGKLRRGTVHEAAVARTLADAAASEDAGLRRAAIGAQQRRAGETA